MPMIGLCAVALALGQSPVGTASAQTPASWHANGAFAALRVGDLDSMMRWYREVLGFELVNHQKERQAALLKRGGSVLELIQRSGPPAVARATHAQDLAQPGIIKFGLVVDDFDGLQKSLDAKGVAVLGKVIRSDVDGLRTLAVTDPEGNMLQFFGR